jgi:hypothetical protein
MHTSPPTKNATREQTQSRHNYLTQPRSAVMTICLGFVPQQFPANLLGLDLLKGVICLLSSISFGYGGLVVILTGDR